jgi:DNA transformation protein
VLDTFLAAKDFMNGGTSQPWWHFTPLRKANKLIPE